MATSFARLQRIDPLGALVAAVGAAALLWLPFVVFKLNRILPGDARTLAQVVELWRGHRRRNWPAPWRS